MRLFCGVQLGDCCCGTGGQARAELLLLEKRLIHVKYFLEFLKVCVVPSGTLISSVGKLLF